MQTLKLEIEDSNLDIVLNIIQNLKDNLVSKIEQKDFIKISDTSLQNVWDNKEDDIYDKFL